jgi:hypothetical protein
MTDLAYSAKNIEASDKFYIDNADGEVRKKRNKDPDDGTLRWIVKKGLRKFKVKMIKTYFNLDYAKILGLILLRRQIELRPKLNLDLQFEFDEMIMEIESRITF